MHIKDFLTEQWMNDYERQARINLTDTSAQSLSLQDLQKMEPDLFENLVLDYGWITGDPELRKEILSLYENRDENTLTITNGALQANEMIMSLLLEPDDHVITFRPGYQQFADFPRFLGCTAEEIDFQETDWSIDYAALEHAIQANPKTSMIVLANPSNPTGTWLNRSELEKLSAIARKYDLYILCDEVYRGLGEDETSIADVYEKGIATGSLSKLFGLPGIRLGWIKTAPQSSNVIEKVNVFRDYTIISAGPLSEAAALAALRHKDEIAKANLELIESNKAIVRDWLARSPYFSCVLPEKGTVSFLKLPEGVNSEDFARRLLKDTGIFFVPGSCFDKEGYLRFSFGKKQEDLAGALDALEAYMAGWKNESLDSFDERVDAFLDDMSDLV